MTIEEGISDLAVSRKRVAWGITGSGDRLAETIEVMKTVKRRYDGEVDIRAYLSKAGHTVLTHYGLRQGLEESFSTTVEVDSNTPFLAGQLQLGRFEFLLIAPATSNTVAKISSSIADSLLSNAAVMALKGFTPVYIMPSDLREGTVTTKLPNGRNLKLRVRKEDVENVRKLALTDGISILESPEDIIEVFEKHFGEDRR